MSLFIQCYFKGRVAVTPWKCEFIVIVEIKHLSQIETLCYIYHVVIHSMLIQEQSSDHTLEICIHCYC